MADFRINVIIDPARTASGGRRVRGELTRIDKAADKVGKTLRNVFLLTGIGVGIGALIGLGDEFTNIQNRIRVVTSDTRELTTATDELFAIAQRTRSDFAATADVFSRVSLAARDLGISQQQTLAFTESLNQAVILSGASAQEAQAGLIQLSQGLASGALRGDELRSVLEQLPVVADVIADSLGVTRGELRELGAEGAITADIVLNAFGEARAELADRFGRTVPTIGQAFGNLRNSVVNFIGDMNEATSATALLAEGVLSLSRGIDGLGIAFSRNTFGFGRDADELEGQIRELENLQGQLQAGLVPQVIDPTTGQTGGLIFDPVEAQRQLDELLPRIERLRDLQLSVLENGGVFVTRRDVSDVTGRFDDINRQLDEFIADQDAAAAEAAEKFVQQFATAEERAVAELEKLNDFVRQGLIGPEEAEAIRARLDDIINPLEEITIDQPRRELSDLGQVIFDSTQNAENLQEQLDALARGGLEEFRAVETLQRARAVLADVGDTAGITAEELAKILTVEEELRAEVEKTTEAIAGQDSSLEDFFRRARENSQDILAGFLESGLNDIEQFERAFLDMLVRLSSQALAADIFEALFGPNNTGIGGGTGTGGLGGFLGGAVDFLGGLFGFQNGGSFRVGGSGGPDSQLVAFRASPMENVTITPPGGAPPGQAAPPNVMVQPTPVFVVDSTDKARQAIQSGDFDDEIIAVLERQSETVQNIAGG